MSPKQSARETEDLQMGSCEKECTKFVQPAQDHCPKSCNSDAGRLRGIRGCTKRQNIFFESWTCLSLYGQSLSGLIKEELERDIALIVATILNTGKKTCSCKIEDSGP